MVDLNLAFGFLHLVNRAWLPQTADTVEYPPYRDIESDKYIYSQ
jgi:hypothetical protein